MDKYKAWWGNLTGKDQLTYVAISAAIVIFIVIWAWFSLTSSVIDAQNKLNRQQNLLSYVHTNGAQIIYAGGDKLGEKNKLSLSQIVENSARELRININTSGNGTNDFTVEIPDVEFKTFIKWTNQLKLRYGVMLADVRLQAKNGKGRMIVRKLTFAQ